MDKGQLKFSPDTCILCSNVTSEKLTCVTDIGLSTLRYSCEARSRSDIICYLDSRPSKVYLHNSCRKSFNRSKDICKLRVEKQRSLDEIPAKRTLRSEVNPFNWKHLCFLCEMEIDGAGDKRVVRTLELGDSLSLYCKQRGDEWAVKVLGRLESCHDLVAEEAVYHVKCLARFRKGLCAEAGKANCGRPEIKDCMLAFNRLCDHLEMTCEYGLYTLDDLYELMRQLNPDEDDKELYSLKHIKNLLIERYQEHIFFAEIKGRKNVVCFRNLCNFIISESWYRTRNDDSDREDERIVKTAARLIAAQIRDIKVDMDNYPSLHDLKSDGIEIVSPLLTLFLQSLISAPIKQSALAQCIIQSSRPRTVLMPLQFGLGVQLDHLFGSKFLIQHLSRLGFCCSYDEVNRFKKSVLNSTAASDYFQQLASDSGMAFTQFVADNVDHNVCTVDGSGTFHGMGIIAATVFDSGTFNISNAKIKRVPAATKTSDLCKIAHVEIVEYHKHSGSGLHCIQLKELKSLHKELIMPAIINLSSIWHASGFLQPANMHRPNWCGYMQTVCTGGHNSPAEIRMLPIINLNPSDESCILSTLLFVIKQNRKSNSPTTCCITFDQPLYIKAVDISTAENLDIVCRLGGFHLLMSFLSAIGHVMEGSGLEDVMSQMYGPNTVEQVMKGRAYTRAVRGHIIVHDALTKLMLQSHASACVTEERMSEDVETFNITSNENFDQFQTVQPLLDECQLQELSNVVESVWRDKVDSNDVSILHSSSITVLNEKVEILKNELLHKSRTSKLWLNYMYYVELVKRFILAERTSNWDLHLHVVVQMLNLFASTGRNNYAKSARLYVQQMYDLPNSHPELHGQFNSGKHAIRRSDRFWSGLSSDLVIEQTMMKSVKGKGGLTRGRGMHDSARAIWVNTVSECASVHMSMSSVTGMECKGSDHTEVAKARVKRDCTDMQKVNEYLKVNSPFRFSDPHTLVSISSGLTASLKDNVTCDDAIGLGQRVQQLWDNVVYTEIKTRKTDKVTTLASLSNTCTIEKDKVAIDVNSLFQRLVIVAERSGDIQSFFQYELTHHPTSLFAHGLMRKPNKPDLCKAFKRDLQGEALPQTGFFVVDGGCLLHKVRWQVNKTFGEIVVQYLRYVMSKFGRNAVVIFDGYSDNPSTKDHEHKRRSGRVAKTAPDVSVEVSNRLIFEQEAFLANSRNKAGFIQLLHTFLLENSIGSHVEEGDADTGIVNEALKHAVNQQFDVVVFAEDTDILALLLFHRKPHMSDMYMWSEGKRKQKSHDKVVNIRKLQEATGRDACNKILVLHAFGGCDTTSAIFSQGKGTIFKKLSSNKLMSVHVSTLQNPNATTNEVTNAGKTLMVALYGGKNSDNLASLRYSAYSKMISTSLKRLQPERLPPSEAAASFHAMRVHLQAVTWKTLGAYKGDPTVWGWKLNGKELTPVTTDKPIAPDNILHIIRCNCKGNCSTTQCSCRANSLTCVSACGNCHGTECSNVEAALVETESDDDYDHSEVLMDEDFHCIDEEVVECEQQMQSIDSTVDIFSDDEFDSWVEEVV